MLQTVSRFVGINVEALETNLGWNLSSVCVQSTLHTTFAKDASRQSRTHTLCISGRLDTAALETNLSIHVQFVMFEQSEITATP